MATLPRWLTLLLAPLVWLVAIPLAHAVVPWAMSSLGPRYGWVTGRPAAWNLLGLVLVAAGAGVLVWLTVFGFAQASRLPERITLDWSPKLLLTQGPYALTRHPMYLAELMLWLGWAVFYGSLAVSIGFLVLCLLVKMLAAREEQVLEANFGEAYREYKARVPRWLGNR